VQTLNKDAYGWLVETNEWIGQHMTLAAAADFKAAHEEFGTAYPLNGSHPNQIQLEYNWLHMDLPQHLNNLRFLMVNDAMDPQS
jgi:hypothetical protein